jgi:hypothetical protein
MAGKTRVILSRPKFNYDPAMQFYLRMFVVMFDDARKTNPDGTPTDEAILARAWFAWSEWNKEEDGKRQFTNWPEVCHFLDRDWHVETAAALQVIDACADFETPYAIRRLKELAAIPDQDEHVLSCRNGLAWFLQSINSQCLRRWLTKWLQGRQQFPVIGSFSPVVRVKTPTKAKRPPMPPAISQAWHDPSSPEWRTLGHAELLPVRLLR